MHLVDPYRKNRYGIPSRIWGTQNIGKCVIPSRNWGTPTLKSCKCRSHYFKSEKQTNTILMVSFFGKNVESWMGMLVLGSDSCGLWANRPSWNTCIPAKQTCRKVLLETCWRPLLLITQIEFLFTTPTKQYMNARIPASSPKQLGRWRRWFKMLSRQLFANHFCLFKVIVYFVPW